METYGCFCSYHWFAVKSGKLKQSLAIEFRGAKGLEFVVQGARKEATEKELQKSVKETPWVFCWMPISTFLGEYSMKPGK